MTIISITPGDGVIRDDGRDVILQFTLAATTIVGDSFQIPDTAPVKCRHDQTTLVEMVPAVWYVNGVRPGKPLLIEIPDSEETVPLARIIALALDIPPSTPVSTIAAAVDAWFANNPVSATTVEALTDATVVGKAVATAADAAAARAAIGVVASGVQSPVYGTAALSEWAMALRKRQQTPAKVAVISGSMSEMVAGGGSRKSWIDLLGDRIFVPAQAEWGTGVCPGGADFLNPSTISGSGYIDAEVGTHRPVRRGISSSGGYIEFDVAEFSCVRLVVIKVSWSGYPTYQLDGGTAVDSASHAWTAWDTAAGSNSSTVVGPSFDVASAQVLRLNKPSSGDLIVQGIIGDKVLAPQTSVLNLSRSGTRSDEWTDWLSVDRMEDDSMGNLLRGFGPDLVAFGSWGNDFWQNGAGSLTQSTLNSRLDTLYARLQVLAPNASFFSWTEPPIDNDGGARAAWLTFCDWIAQWNTANDIPFLLWHTTVPEADTDVEYYGSDGTHGNVAFAQVVADLSAPIMLPR